MKSLKQLVVGSKVEGDFKKSKVVTFNPGTNLIKRSDYTADCGTPGSVFLISQMLLPCLLFQIEPEIKLTIKGGTIVSKSPPYDTYVNVLIPALNSMGAIVSADIKYHGLFPDLVGEMSLSIKNMNEKLKPIDWT